MGQCSVGLLGVESGYNQGVRHPWGARGKAARAKVRKYMRKEGKGKKRKGEGTERVTRRGKKGKQKNRKGAKSNGRPKQRNVFC